MSNERIIKTELTADNRLLVTKIIEVETTEEYDLIPIKKEPEMDPLTPTELKVLKMIAAGYTNKEIAEIRVSSIRTIESHRANLMAKLGLDTRWQLVKYWREHYEKP